MILSVKQLTDDTEFEEIGRIDATGDREIVTGEDELLGMDDREVWLNMPVERLAMRYNGPVVMLDVIEDDSDVTQADATVAELDVTAGELTQLASASDYWTATVTDDGAAWLDGKTDTLVVQRETPEGVPDDYNYVPPDKQPPEDADVVESDHGGTYTEASPDELTEVDDGESHDPDPAVDIDRFRESEDAAGAIASANDEPTEGFTFHRDLELQPLGDRDEWAVGLGLGPDQFEREMTKDDVVEVYDEYQDLLADTPGLRIGGYHFEEGGRYEIEISVTVTDADEAEQLGEELNQESVFNLGTEELIFTDGDGDSPISDPNDVREVLEDVSSVTEAMITLAVQKANSNSDMAADHDHTSLFVADDGEEMTFAQIANASAKDPDVTVEESDDGFRVNGKTFEPADE